MEEANGKETNIEKGNVEKDEHGRGKRNEMKGKGT